MPKESPTRSMVPHINIGAGEEISIHLFITRIG